MDFQRLEDFSSYTSCIKLFGKPIIPPLVTAEKRDEICSLRTAAIKKEIKILKKESYLHPSRKVKEIFTMVAEHLAVSSISNDFLPYHGDVQHNCSALHSSGMNELTSSPSTDIRSFENSMHMSMTKISSNDICSTVHTGVIVCPNIYNKKHENGRIIDVKSISCSVPPMEFCFHMANPDCSLCQTEHPRGPFPLAGVPYINSPAERICSVSDEEQGSVAEETEFESLVTVISGKKVSAQDTDNESNFTCLTQSTDLEKYMDCSIEYSSPDDGASLTKSQMSNQLNISLRSDDASSETLVNTESELTPCASALAELNEYINEDNFENSHTKEKVSSSDTLVSSEVQQRAQSVDSYMKIVKTCARNLLMKKSQSEPSHSNLSNISNNFCPLRSSRDDGNYKPANVKLKGFTDVFEMPKDSVHCAITDTELSCDNIADPSIEQKKIFQKGHIRTSSYTLEEPSSALIMAHADCNCKDDSETVMSPHSCASEKTITPTTNPAFKKEKINIVLPPTPDRDKYFPLLSSSTYHQEGNDEFELETPVFDTTESTAPAEDNNISNATNMENTNSKENETSKSNLTELENLANDTPSQPNTDIVTAVNLEQVENSVEDEKKDNVFMTEEEEADPNERNIVISPTSPNKLKGDDLQSFLNNIILEIQEKQQTRVQKLLDEQNKQWLELQEEFKEQEKLLCSKLNLVGISSSNDNVLENKSPSQSGEKNKQNIVDTLPANFQIYSDMKSLFNHNIRNKNNKESLTATESFSTASEISLVKNSEDKTNNEENSFIDEHRLNTPTQHSSFCEDSIALIEKQTTNTAKPSYSADSTNLNSSFSGDSLERSHNINSTRSSGCFSSLDCHKSQSINDVISRCSSVQSENFTISMPYSHSFSKMNNTPPDTMQTVNYQPTVASIFSSFASNVSENIQKPAFEKPRSLKLESSYDTNSLLKDRVFEGYPSIAITSSLPSYACPHSEMQLLIDRTDQANLYATSDPQKELEAGELIPPTYLPSAHWDNLALDKKEEYSQNASACHHFSGKEYFDESSIFTSLSNCTSMALPIIANSATVRHHENDLTCNHYDKFKDPTANIESIHSSQTAHFNSREKFTKESGASIHQQWYPEQNNFAFANLKNKMSNHDHFTHQDFKAKGDSAILNSSGRSHSSMVKNTVSNHPSDTSKKSQSDSSVSQNIHQVPTNAIPTTTQAKIQKQIISSSLTNLKRKQSKDFIRDPNILKKFEKLPAFVKGYLTRRLFKTERVQGLIKTLQDTALLIGKLGEELTLKGDAVSEHDVDFHRQLIVQLMTTFHSVYDIFCTISVKERMKIISESRSFEKKKKAAEKTKESPTPIIAEIAATAVPPRRSKLSTATLKALERKRRSTIDNRTYTVEDLKGCRARIHSFTSSKSHSSSPSRIYKTSLGLALKRKTTNVRKMQHWK